MRAAFLISALMLALALSGCADPPKEGELNSSGSAFSLADGSVAKADFVEFNDPTPQQLQDAGQSCTADGSPAPLDPVTEPYKCTPASSDIAVHFMSLADADWSMALGDSTGANPRGDASPLVAGGNGTMYDWMAMSDNEDYSDTYDQVELLHAGNRVGTAPLSANGAFTVSDELSGISFTLAYKGKDVTMTVSGIGTTNNFTFEGWLISTEDADGDGALDHAESFAVVDGENMYTAEMTGNKYSGAHIHVTGTKINVAVGAFA